MIYLLCLRLSDNKENSISKDLKPYLLWFFCNYFGLFNSFSTGSLNVLLSILEDGGEMIPISIICSYFFDKIQSIRNKKLLHF